MKRKQVIGENVWLWSQSWSTFPLFSLEYFLRKWSYLCYTGSWEFQWLNESILFLLSDLSRKKLTEAAILNCWQLVILKDVVHINPTEEASALSLYTLLKHEPLFDVVPGSKNIEYKSNEQRSKRVSWSLAWNCEIFFFPRWLGTWHRWFLRKSVWIPCNLVPRTSPLNFGAGREMS